MWSLDFKAREFWKRLVNSPCKLRMKKEVWKKQRGGGGEGKFCDERKSIFFFYVGKIKGKKYVFLCLIRIFWNFFMRAFKIQNQSFAIILLGDFENLRVMSHSNFLTMLLTDEIFFNVNFIWNTRELKKITLLLENIKNL